MTDRKQTSLSKGALTLDNAYKFYKGRAKNIPENIKITKKLYRDICKDYNKLLVDQVVDGAVITLPGKLGLLCIKKRKVDLDKPRFDYGHFKKTGEKVFHDNWHSEGFFAMWNWDKRGNRGIKNMVFYNFAPTFTNRSKVAQVMKEPGGHKRYFE